MGTNFYLHTITKCPTCGGMTEAKPKHIGKSSAGWCFSLHVYPDDDGPRPLLITFDAWRCALKKPRSWIEDEYGDAVTPDEMLSHITDRAKVDRGKPPTDEFLRRHGAIWDAKYGLLRNKVNGHHCRGNGPGTYDYIVGNFS